MLEKELYVGSLRLTIDEFLGYFFLDGMFFVFSFPVLFISTEGVAPEDPCIEIFLVFQF